MLTLSAKGDVSSTRECPVCESHTFERDLIGDVSSVEFNRSAAKYAGRFPYISNHFPFHGKGAKHHGRLGKCIIENAEHEAKMRRDHGYVGENKAIFTDDVPKNGTIFPKSKLTPEQKALRDLHLTPKAIAALEASNV